MLRFRREIFGDGTIFHRQIFRTYLPSFSRELIASIHLSLTNARQMEKLFVSDFRAGISSQASVGERSLLENPDITVYTELP